MSAWYYLDASGIQQGPVDDATLTDLGKIGRVLAKTLVWTDGTEQWTPYQSVAGRLFAAQSNLASSDGVILPVPIGVCAFSGIVQPLEEMLPYGDATVAPEFKDRFVQWVMEEGKTHIRDAAGSNFTYVGFWWRVLGALLDYMVKMIPSSLCMIPYYIASFVEGVSQATHPSEGAPPETVSTMGDMSIFTILAYGLGMLANLGISIGYDTWMVGRYQATLGKMAIGAKVVAPDGSRISYGRAFYRWFIKKPVNWFLVWIPPTLGITLTMGGIIPLLSRSGDDQTPLFVAAFAGSMILFCVLVLLGLGVYWMAAFDSEKRALHDRIVATRVIRK